MNYDLLYLNLYLFINLFKLFKLFYLYNIYIWNYIIMEYI